MNSCIKQLSCTGNLQYKLKSYSGFKEPGIEYKWDSDEAVDYTDAWLPNEPDVSARCEFPFLFRDKPYEECIDKVVILK